MRRTKCGRLARIAGASIAMAMLSSQAFAARYWVAIDQHWYPVEIGTVEAALDLDLVDIISLELPPCQRTGGGLPPNGPTTMLMGSFNINVVSGAHVDWYLRSQLPIVHIETEFGDVRCGSGQTPPADVVAHLDRAVSRVFAAGFE